MICRPWHECVYNTKMFNKYSTTTAKYDVINETDEQIKGDFELLQDVDNVLVRRITSSDTQHSFC